MLYTRSMNENGKKLTEVMIELNLLIGKTESIFEFEIFVKFLPLKG